LKGLESKVVIIERREQAKVAASRASLPVGSKVAVSRMKIMRAIEIVTYGQQVGDGENRENQEDAGDHGQLRDDVTKHVGGVLVQLWCVAGDAEEEDKGREGQVNQRRIHLLRGKVEKRRCHCDFVNK
jgi:hypothetical protein